MNIKDTIQLKIITRTKSFAKTDIIKAILNNLGISLKDIVEFNSKSINYIYIYFKNIQKAKRIKDTLTQVRHLKVEIRKLNKKDWFDNKEIFKPFMLTKELKVVPIWMKGRYKPRTDFIYLDSRYVFGSGLHETTRFMAQLIEGCRNKFNDFLDVGTGSGILPLVAIKNGARSVDAIDINRDIIKIARQNLATNGYYFNNLSVSYIQGYNKRKKYDFVAANLVTSELIENKDKILSFVKNGGYLALSGVSLENLKTFKSAFKAKYLKVLKIIKGKNWVAVLFRRRVK